ncbi:hypothetical protein HWV62_9589, partial [Athelia sp. TMB]
KVVIRNGDVLLTIGYGDYSPQTPAGRSIFVVWAIMGVGALTLLISVVQEAYDSKYKRALHIGAFDKAVKRYRVKLQINRETKDAEKTTVVPRTRAETGITLPELSEDISIQQNHSNVSAQETLEALPSQILEQARTLRKYVRAFAADDDASEGEETKEVTQGLRKLLDEIAGAVGVGRVSKAEIMQDVDARHTLFRLSLEKSLHKIIDGAEEAMEAIRRRDAALSQKERKPS